MPQIFIPATVEAEDAYSELKRLTDKIKDAEVSAINAHTGRLVISAAAEVSRLYKLRLDCIIRCFHAGVSVAAVRAVTGLGR